MSRKLLLRSGCIPAVNRPATIAATLGVSGATVYRALADDISD
jgi:hypothetical protein